MVDADLLGELEDADRLQEAERAQAVGVGGVFRHIEGHLDVGHRAEVVDLVGLDVADEPDQVGRVAKVAVMQRDLLHVDIADEILHVEVLDAAGVEGGGTADEPVDLIALAEQELREVGTVLPGDAGDERALFHDKGTSGLAGLGPGDDA